MRRASDRLVDRPVREWVTKRGAVREQFAIRRNRRSWMRWQTVAQLRATLEVTSPVAESVPLTIPGFFSTANSRRSSTGRRSETLS